MKITKKLHTAIQCAEETKELTEDYIIELQEKCGEQIEADTVTWDSDDDNIYLTTAYGDDILNFTIPKKDLKVDIDKDSKYILEAVDVEVEAETEEVEEESTEEEIVETEDESE
jgi:hypothetical protein